MTSALVHILREYPYLKQSLVTRIFEAAGHEAPGLISIDTQRSMTCVGEAEPSSGRARPDIVFTDRHDETSTILILENKFKNGCTLTEKQPVDYIRLLAKHRPTGMVLVAPESQIPYYERECHALCQNAGLMNAEARHLNNPNQFLSFLSWQRLVKMLCEEALLKTIPDGGIPTVICDLSQLKGLLNHMEETEIKPFSIEDFDEIRRVAFRLPQLNRILARIGQKLPERFKTSWEAFPSRPDLAREDGVNVHIKGKLFWLVPDFTLLSKQSMKDPNTLSAFWLRIGFFKGWMNHGTSEPEMERIRAAMEATTRTVVAEPLDCLSMALPFQAGQPEEQILRSLIKMIEQLELNLGVNSEL